MAFLAGSRLDRFDLASLAFVCSDKEARMTHAQGFESAGEDQARPLRAVPFAFVVPCAVLGLGTTGCPSAPKDWVACNCECEISGDLSGRAPLLDPPGRICVDDARDVNKIFDGCRTLCRAKTSRSRICNARTYDFAWQCAIPTPPRGKAGRLQCG